MGSLEQKIHECCSYDLSTGVFVWNGKTGTDASSCAWNATVSGKVIGRPDKDGYLIMRIRHEGKKRYLRLHRVAWLMVYGCWPEGDIDHINHDRADNRIENLRSVTRSINHRNMTRSTRNSSGVVGVSRLGEKWRARFFHNGSERRVGYFSSVEDAEAALREARAKVGYHQNHGAEK